MKTELDEKAPKVPKKDALRRKMSKSKAPRCEW